MVSRKKSPKLICAEFNISLYVGMVSKLQEGFQKDTNHTIRVTQTHSKSFSSASFNLYVLSRFLTVTYQQVFIPESLCLSTVF